MLHYKQVAFSLRRQNGRLDLFVKSFALLGFS